MYFSRFLTKHRNEFRQMMPSIDGEYFLVLLVISLIGLVETSSHYQRSILGEIDGTVAFVCELDQLPSNAIITWVYRPKNHKSNGIRWLPLYANARRLTQNNQRFIVDYLGHNGQTNKSQSILTIQALQASDEGLYMCKSNQYQSMSSVFNLTISPSLKIYPEDEMILFNDESPSINLSCVIREVSMHPLDPLRLKWFHNDREFDSIYIIEQSSHWNEGKLLITIPRWLLKDSDLFRCVYDNGKASKDVRIVFPSNAIFDYSKSMALTTFLNSSLTFWFGILFLLR